MSIDVRDIGGVKDTVIVDHALAQPLVRDELQTVVAMLCARFPERSRVEVEWLVTDLYQRLSESARIHAHLIPLTLNGCRRILSEHRPGVRLVSCRASVPQPTASTPMEGS
jgi:hypothetical protein